MNTDRLDMILHESEQFRDSIDILDYAHCSEKSEREAKLNNEASKYSELGLKEKQDEINNIKYVFIDKASILRKNFSRVIDSELEIIQGDLDKFYAMDNSQDFLNQINTYKNHKMSLSIEELESLSKNAKSYPDKLLMVQYVKNIIDEELNGNEEYKTMKAFANMMGKTVEQRVVDTDRVAQLNSLLTRITPPDKDSTYKAFNEYKNTLNILKDYYSGYHNSIKPDDVDLTTSVTSNTFITRNHTDSFKEILSKLDVPTIEPIQLSSNQKKYVEKITQINEYPFSAKETISELLRLNPDLYQLFISHEKTAPKVRELESKGLLK